MANTRGKRKEMEPVDEVTEAVETTESTESAPTAKEASVKEGAVFNCGNLNVREEPSLSGKILTIIKSDTKVKVLDEVDEWYKVRVTGTISGFCMKEFIKLDK